MKLLALAELIPLVLMGAAAQAPSCVEQRPANEASATAASGPRRDLSLYPPEELEIYQADCDYELKAAIDRGDNASAQSWARSRAALIAEKQRRLQILATPTPSQTPRPTAHKTTKRRRYHRPVMSESTPGPTRESAPRPTPEEYPLPPGWPVGPKE
jgi:hypothetical protein